MPPKNSKKSDKPADTPVDELTYEAAIEELESIIDRIESGEIGLEESVKAYERGVALRRRCEEILCRAEQRVEELTPREPDRKPAKGEHTGEEPPF